MDSDMLIIGVIGFIALWLIMQKWFWIIALFIATIASIFSIIASIIHFQILGALGFTLVAAITASILSALFD